MDYTLLYMCVLGLAVGSFLNVCVYRLPRGQSVITPRSCCPACGTPIPFYENIPLLSYALLRGRCRSCRARISLQYPAIEAITGLTFVVLAHRYGVGLQLVPYLVFACALICIFFIDLRWLRIPNVFTFSLIPIGLAAGFLWMPAGWRHPVSGMLLGFGLLFMVALLYRKATGIEGMGAGDIKLGAMIGCYLGATQTLTVIVLAAVLGSIVGAFLIAGKKAGRRTALPFGSFLAAAALFVLLAPQKVTGVLWTVAGRS